jgi:hypothetical protein
MTSNLDQSELFTMEAQRHREEKAEIMVLVARENLILMRIGKRSADASQHCVLRASTRRETRARETWVLCVSS